MHIGEVIQHIRTDEQMSQEEFGALFNLGQRDISFIERGKVDPDISLLNRIALRFDSPVMKAYICGYKDASLIDEAIENFKRHGKVIYA